MIEEKGNQNVVSAQEEFLAVSNPVVLAPTLDEEKYRSKLAALDLTIEQENALLRTLWSMMTTFVDLGFGLDSVQNIIKSADESSLYEESSSIQQEQESEVTASFQQASANTHDDKELPQ